MPPFAWAQLVGVELLQNGDAEAGDLTGWTATSGFRVIEDTLACPAPAPGGGKCFHGGTGQTTMTLVQVVDVSGLSGQIDAGAVTASISLLGYSACCDSNGDPDRLLAVFDFEDETSSPIQSIASGVLGEPNF